MPTVWARAGRDWRVRTTLPVVGLHVVAFAGLYALTYELAMREIAAAFGIGASYVLEESVEVFTDTAIGHAGSRSEMELEFVAGAHAATTIALFSPAGELRTLAGAREPFDPAVVRNSFEDEGPGDIRIRRTGSRVLATGIRSLRNAPECRSCHAAGPPVLGTIGVQRDLGEWVRGTAGRLRWGVAAVSVGWALLLGASLLIRNRVIGRPLAQIAEAVRVPARPGGKAAPHHDLEQLAGSVHGTIGSLLERQQVRDRQVERGMERATQLAVLGDVAAGLSHEIKNPLAGLRAALDALRRDDALPPDEKAEILDAMISEVDRVNRTVEALLSLARPRGLVRTPTDVGRLVTKATALLEARARARGVRLAVEAAPGLPLLDLDSDLVTQVVVNLATNALDAVKDGGEVRVTVEPFPDRDGVALSVTDDGEGIPEESRARVFEPFFTTKHGGTGLGLPLCHRIVNEHGGTMTLESETGRGTTVVALFPARDVPAKRRAVDLGVDPAG